MEPHSLHWIHFEYRSTHIVYSDEDRCTTWIFEYRQKRIRTLILNFSTLRIKKKKEVFCEKINTQDVKQNGSFIFDELLKWLHGGYKVLLRDYRSINQASKQAKNVFERKIMILRNITWIHSFIQIEMIKRCCPIHVFRNSLILIWYNIIIFTYFNVIFIYSNIHCLITLICLIILISNIVKLLLIRKFYCFRPGAHISF